MTTLQVLDQSFFVDMNWKIYAGEYEQLLQLEEKPLGEVFIRGEKPINPFSTGDEGAIVCCDERVILGRDDVQDYAIAGSGILLNKNTYWRAVNNAIKRRVKTVSWHDSCGAAQEFCRLYYEKHGKRKDPNEEAYKAARRLLRDIGQQGEPHHFTKEDLIGSHEYHHARSIAIDGTNRLSLHKLGVFSAFKISYRFLPLYYIRNELRIILNIAIGDHGYGREKFLVEPLAVVIFGDKHLPRYNAENIYKRLEMILVDYAPYIKVILTNV